MHKLIGVTAAPRRTLAVVAGALLVVTVGIVLSHWLMNGAQALTIQSLLLAAMVAVIAVVVLSHVAYARRGIERLRLELQAGRRDIVNSRDRLAAEVKESRTEAATFALRGADRHNDSISQMRRLEERITRLEERLRSREVGIDDRDLLEAYLFDLSINPLNGVSGLATPRNAEEEASSV